jgi:hypothetical protein
MYSCLFGEDISKFIDNDKIGENEDYSLDEKNIDRFLRECNNDIRPIIRKIIDNTKYISFENFMRSLFKSIKILNDELKKLDKKIIYLYECRCKCNKWLFEYLYRMITFFNSEIKIKIINDNYKNFKDDDFIILPFDCLYTGFQITKNTKILCDNNKYKKNIIIYVLSPYMSSYGIFNMKNKKMEKEYNYKLIIGNHIKIDKYLITEILNFKEIELLRYYYPSKVPENKINLESNLENIYFFYFNHKLGDLNSTLTLLYMGVIPNDFNRRKLLYEYEDKKLQIIPLIKNCNFVYNNSNIDTHNPICPPPIY